MKNMGFIIIIGPIALPFNNFIVGLNNYSHAYGISFLFSALRKYCLDMCYISDH